MPEVTPRQLLLQRLKEKKRERLGAEDAIPRRGLGTAPLSFAQQRLWFLEQLEPGNARFNILTAVRIQGEIDPPTFARALDAVVERHESLRTRFESRNGQPAQHIDPQLAIPLPEADLAGLPEDRREKILHALVKQEAATPFDLARGPLTRALLLRMAAGHRVLVLSMHQIIVDRWSRGVLVRELTALYEAFLDGLPSPLAELPIQYADFAVWQREWLTGEVLDRLLGYWQRQLGGTLAVLDLPTDRPRPAVLGDRGHMQYDVLPQADLDRLKALGQREGTTLFITLWAAFAALLNRYTGQEDLTVGSPIANRNRPEIEGLIGFFVNMLPLRLRLAPGASFADLLGAAREAALAAYEHQDLPFERLVDELGVTRDLSRHPVFQSTLILQNTAMPPLALRQASLSLVEIDWGSTAFDLALFCWETRLWESLEAGLSLIVSYSSELFDSATLRRLTGHFKVLLRAAVADPGRPLRELDLLPAAERHQLLHEGGGTEPAEPALAASIPALFAARAARQPQALALDFADGQLTFGELAAAGREVAAGLHHAGVPAGAVVGLLAERGAVAITGLLGILAAGCAYLPLEPEDPPERRESLLASAGAAALLTPGPAGPLDRGADRWQVAPRRGAGRRPAPAAAGPGGESLACVLPTSGSSGRPRAVALPHRAILRLALDGALPTLGPGDRVAQAARLSFDASLYEIWGALLAGATVVGVERDVLLSPPLLGRLLNERGVSTLFLSTALFHRLAGEAPALFAGLRELLVGG
ncbi:MAG TPA: condensation domain-containing protein, partial [Thermoanaerobaculia bacterium]|nr:condensation domain-containing protein [Thermoanaerobaculia bacterium]